MLWGRNTCTQRDAVFVQECILKQLSSHLQSCSQGFWYSAAKDFQTVGFNVLLEQSGTLLETCLYLQGTGIEWNVSDVLEAKRKEKRINGWLKDIVKISRSKKKSYLLTLVRMAWQPDWTVPPSQSLPKSDIWCTGSSRALIISGLNRANALISSLKSYSSKRGHYSSGLCFVLHTPDYYLLPIMIDSKREKQNKTFFPHSFLGPPGF